MQVSECMTGKVELAYPSMSIRDAALKMSQGDFGILPVGDGDRLVGMISDRDITVRVAAEGRDPKSTTVGDVMSKNVLYCFEDQTVESVAHNMGDNQVRRLPVLNREKRLVGILSLGDIACSKTETKEVGKALEQISEPAESH